jgi:hypothetical protein
MTCALGGRTTTKVTHRYKRCIRMQDLLQQPVSWITHVSSKESGQRQRTWQVPAGTLCPALR